MQDYPVDGGLGMSQAHNGSKMLLELPLHTTTPAVRVRGLIFYVGELLQRSDWSFYIPERFFSRQGQLYALGWRVSCSTVGVSIFDFTRVLFFFHEAGFKVDEQRAICQTDDFALSYLELLEEGHLRCGFSGKSHLVQFV